MTDGQVEENEQEHETAFEKARFNYCVKVYEKEAERKDTLEKKSQFLLSIITLFLGAIFLKMDFFETLQKLIVQKSPPVVLTWLIYISMIVFAVTLLISLIAVLQTMRLQRFKNEYPDNVISSLFDPGSKYLNGKDEPGFFRATATSYAIALEFNTKINDAKAVWVKVAWSSVSASAISLAFFLSLFAFVSML